MQQIEPAVGKNNALALLFERVDSPRKFIMVFDDFMAHGYPVAQNIAGAYGSPYFFPYEAMAVLSSSAESVAVPGFMTTTDAA
jgi:hypothetical protein